MSVIKLKEIDGHKTKRKQISFALSKTFKFFNQIKFEETELKKRTFLTLQVFDHPNKNKFLCK